MSVLRVRDLRVGLRTTGTVLRGIDLDLSAGECIGIVGESGAGKSVLARTLLGLHSADPDATVSASTFDVLGNDMRRASQKSWRALRGTGISLVLQDALQSLDPLRTIGAEVAETLIAHGRRKGVEERVTDALTAAGLAGATTLTRRHSEELSGGMRQRALIASATIGSARVIIADEPTTALDATTALKVTDLLVAQKAAGTAIIFISHDLRRVARLADRVAVLERGAFTTTGTTSEVLENPSDAAALRLVAAMPTGAKAHGTPDARLVRQEGPADHTVVLEARSVTKAYDTPGRDRVVALENASLRVRSGQVVGVVGESGSGKSTLAKLLIGAEQPDDGTIVSRAENVRVRLVPQDPLGSFDPRLTVGRILRNAGATTVASRTALLESVHLDPPLLARRPSALSGGQRQRVAIARALASDPDVLICDEAVSALDVTTQAEIIRLLLDLQQSRSLAVVFISHDLAVVRQISDEVFVMRSGHVVEHGQMERVWHEPQSPYTAELIRSARL